MSKLPVTNSKQQIWWIREFTKRMRNDREFSVKWNNWNRLRANAIKEWRTMNTLKAV